MYENLNKHLVNIKVERYVFYQYNLIPITGYSKHLGYNTWYNITYLFI